MDKISFLQKNIFFRSAVYKAAKKRGDDVVSRIECYLNKDDNIVDVGSGTCNICEILSKKGYNVAPLDVQNLSFVNDIKPILYDGARIPFGDSSFDASLIITVLHHTPYPEKIIEEAKRVSKRIIIIEDIYTSEAHKHLTYFLDSLFNLEFAGHAHSNKTDSQWKTVFKEMGLKLIDAKYNHSSLILKHATYCLEK